MAVELNTPRHPWYERRNHVRLPRMAESRTYLDTSFMLPWMAVPIPVGWNFGMLVGADVSSTTGYSPTVAPPYGLLNPLNFMGLRVVLLAITTGNTFILSLHDGTAAAQIPGVNTVTLTAQGFGGSVVTPWVGGSVRYQVTGQTTFGTFLRGVVGQTIGVTLVGAA